MDAIKRIHEFERFGSVLGLERMEILLAKLGNPHRDLKAIHVAGTNGKGSVCRYLYEALQENGYRVGLYISPFIRRFNERIQFDGQEISDEDLESCSRKVLEKAEEMVREGADSPTEFEVVTAIAFLYFAEKKADFVILEVGLGGRGDSTNVVEKPLISIITSISYDHMDRLGSTLEEIAGEKAGIIKDGVPVVSNVEQREAAAVIARTAYQKGCALYDATKPGRFEIAGEEPYLILDGAHNAAGAEALRETMKRCFPERRILMVVGMLADKEIDKITDSFCEITDQFIAAEPDNPRKLPARELARILKEKGAACEIAESAGQAVRMARSHKSEPEVVLFAGSLYLIGSVKEILNHV